LAQCLCLAWMAILLAPAITHAQSPAHPASLELKGSIGYTNVFDDDDHHLHTSVAARLYVTDRFSLEPEAQYLRASSHDDVVITGNVNWDLGRGRVIPYVSGGIGALNGRQLFAQAGMGTKITMGERWFIAPDVRFGYYYHIRSSIGLGYAFRRTTSAATEASRSRTHHAGPLDLLPHLLGPLHGELAQVESLAADQLAVTQGLRLDASRAVVSRFGRPGVVVLHERPERLTRLRDAWR
jgi:hypothetical protein